MQYKGRSPVFNLKIYLYMLKTAMGKQLQEKDYIDSRNTTPGWRTILNIDNYVNCNACTRRIKRGQKMLWHSETDSKMHLAKDCKLW